MFVLILNRSHLSNRHIVKNFPICGFDFNFLTDVFQRAEILMFKNFIIFYFINLGKNSLDFKNSSDLHKSCKGSIENFHISPHLSSPIISILH